MLGKLRQLTAAKGVHYLLTRYGTKKLRKLSFDEKYMSKAWQSSPGGPENELALIVKKYCAGGEILELGCGVASVAGTLKPRSYKSFHGVDMSDAAIALARRQENTKISFETGDMLNYKFTKKYQVILLSESILYIPRRQVKTQLKHYQTGLARGGAFVVTIARPRKHEWILKLIRGEFEVLEDGKFYDLDRHLLVFR